MRSPSINVNGIDVENATDADNLETKIANIQVGIHTALQTVTEREFVEKLNLIVYNQLMEQQNLASHCFADLTHFKQSMEKSGELNSQDRTSEERSSKMSAKGEFEEVDEADISFKFLRNKTEPV